MWIAGHIRFAKHGLYFERESRRHFDFAFRCSTGKSNGNVGLVNEGLRVGANLLGRNLSHINPTRDSADFGELSRAELVVVQRGFCDGNQIAWKLVRDVPANGLNIETLELLKSLLADYQGTMLLVSHDRACLNDVVTSTLVIEDDGLVKQYEGGYDDYLRKRPAEPASQSRPNPDVGRKKPAEAPREQSRKLICKERKKLDGMPGRMEQREKTVQDRHAALVDPSLHRQCRDEIAGARKRSVDLERDLAAVYARWHALEELAG